MHFPKALFILLAFSAVANADNSFQLNSSAAVKGAKIPATYTCDGKDISPPLSWQGAPAATQSYALVVTDPDAPSGTFTHWIIYNIPKDITALAENASLPAGALSGMNSAGKQGYYGPCPPAGPVHHYIFTLYAMAKPLPPNTRATKDVFSKQSLQTAEYVMVYNR